MNFGKKTFKINNKKKDEEIELRLFSFGIGFH